MIPAHITLKQDERPRVTKRFGIHYIIAPDAAKAAELWLKLLEEE